MVSGLEGSDSPYIQGPKACKWEWCVCMNKVKEHSFGFHRCYKLGVVVNICNPFSRETEAGRSDYDLEVSLGKIMKPYLKTK